MVFQPVIRILVGNYGVRLIKVSVGISQSPKLRDYDIYYISMQKKHIAKCI